MASSSDSSVPSWYPWHYYDQAQPVYPAQDHPASAYHPAHLPPNEPGSRAHGDRRLQAVIQNKANLEFDTLKLLEAAYQSKRLRRWADGFRQSFGDVDNAEVALSIVLRNEGINGAAARSFIETLVNALRNTESAQPAPEAPEARARLETWLQAPAVAEIDETKRRRILEQRALLEGRGFPLRTPESRDAWAEAFCQTFFPGRQEFYKDDIRPILKQVVAAMGVTDAEARDVETARLMHGLSKQGACNTKARVGGAARPAQTRRP